MSEPMYERHPDFYNIDVKGPADAGFEPANREQLKRAFAAAQVVMRGVENDADGNPWCYVEQLAQHIVPGNPQAALLLGGANQPADPPEEVAVVFGPYCTGLASLLPYADLLQRMLHHPNLTANTANQPPPVFAFSAPVGPAAPQLNAIQKRQLAGGDVGVLVEPGLELLLDTCQNLGAVTLVGYSAGAGMAAEAAWRLPVMAAARGRVVRVARLVAGAPPLQVGLRSLVQGVRHELRYNAQYQSRTMPFDRAVHALSATALRTMLTNTAVPMALARSLARGPFNASLRTALIAQPGLPVSLLHPTADTSQPFKQAQAYFGKLAQSNIDTTRLDRIAVADAHHPLPHDTVLFMALVYLALERQKHLSQAAQTTDGRI